MRTSDSSENIKLFLPPKHDFIYCSWNLQLVALITTNIRWSESCCVVLFEQEYWAYPPSAAATAARLSDSIRRFHENFNTNVPPCLVPLKQRLSADSSICTMRWFLLSGNSSNIEKNIYFVWAIHQRNLFNLLRFETLTHTLWSQNTWSLFLITN